MEIRNKLIIGHHIEVHGEQVHNHVKYYLQAKLKE